MTIYRFTAIFLLAWVAGLAQTAPEPSPAPTPDDQTPERWNLFYQATSIGQYHGTFNSPYEGPFSLQDYPERDDRGWLKHTLVWIDAAAGARFAARPVHLQPLTNDVESIAPRTRTY